MNYQISLYVWSFPPISGEGHGGTDQCTYCVAENGGFIQSLGKHHLQQVWLS